MRLWDCRFLPVLFSACFAPSCSFHRSRPTPRRKTPRPGPLTPKELKKREKKLRKELSDPDKVWLMEEVPDNHHRRRTSGVLGAWHRGRNANNSLKSFGGIAIPTTNHPSTLPGKEQEHYRRLAYADEHFAFRHRRPARPTAVASTSSGGPPE